MDTYILETLVSTGWRQSGGNVLDPRRSSNRGACVNPPQAGPSCAGATCVCRSYRSGQVSGD